MSKVSDGVKKTKKTALPFFFVSRNRCSASSSTQRIRRWKPRRESHRCTILATTRILRRGDRGLEKNRKKILFVTESPWRFLFASNFYFIFLKLNSGGNFATTLLSMWHLTLAVKERGGGVKGLNVCFCLKYHLKKKAFCWPYSSLQISHNAGLLVMYCTWWRQGAADGAPKGNSFLGPMARRGGSLWEQGIR